MTNSTNAHESASDARTEILASIREQLASSAQLDVIHSTESSPLLGVRHHDVDVEANGTFAHTTLSPVALFQQNLEAIGGHCLVAQSADESAQILANIIAELHATLRQAPRIAISNAPLVMSLLQASKLTAAEVDMTPEAGVLFDYDIGISTAQAAIAETGTLVLDSESERHRLISLVPPVHIAIVAAADICLTLGEALATIHATATASATPGKQTGEFSRVVTFISGPSRTADIELTLSIGVHGPKELYVIVNNAGA